jgi:hypothetical protein
LPAALRIGRQQAGDEGAGLVVGRTVQGAVLLDRLQGLARPGEFDDFFGDPVGVGVGELGNSDLGGIVERHEVLPMRLPPQQTMALAAADRRVELDRHERAIATRTDDHTGHPALGVEPFATDPLALQVHGDVKARTMPELTYRHSLWGLLLSHAASSIPIDGSQEVETKPTARLGAQLADFFSAQDVFERRHPAAAVGHLLFGTGLRFGQRHRPQVRAADAPRRRAWPSPRRGLGQLSLRA